MSDGKVSGDTKSRNIFKPARKANILKAALAVVVGVVLISTIVPATAQAKGPSISIDRVNGKFVVSGHNFSANTQGSVWAQLGNSSTQKAAWTNSDGSFSTTFYTLSNARTGQAQAKAWFGKSYAKTSTTLSKSSGSGTSGGSTATNSAHDGAPDSGTGAPSSTPTTVAAPSTGAATQGGDNAPTNTGAPTTGAPTSGATPTTAAPKTTATTAKPSTPTTAAPKSTSTPAAIGAGTGFTDTPAGWKLAFSDDFTGASLDKSKWGTYDGSGNAGIGSRSSKQVGVSNGELQITGNGTVAGGMASTYKSTYGLYEVRVRMDAASKGYNDAILLWPSSERWPVDGELDMQEIFNGATSQMGSFAHWGSNNSQTGKTTKGDFSQWHTVAVDWEPSSITYYLDGAVIMTVTGAGVPSTPHFIGMQLDVASGGGQQSGAKLHVDWVKAYTKN